MSVGPRVLPLGARGFRFQLSRSALGLSTLRAPSNAGCVSLGARFRRPLIYAGPGISRPRAGAPSPQAVLSVVSDQVSAACAEWLEESTEGEPSGACTALRPCRRSGTPQGIPAAAGRPQGSDFFRAWRAFGEQDNGGGNAAGHARIVCQLTTIWFKRAILH